MNSVVRQLLEQQTDVVMVDTGDSYEGICGYYGGTYISYSKEKPISMNPFKVTAEEYGLNFGEKKNFLKSLVFLIFKGSTFPSKIEDMIVNQTLVEYYDAYFHPFEKFTEKQRAELRQKLLVDAKMEDDYEKYNHEMEDIDRLINANDQPEVPESRALLLPSEVRRMKLVRQCRSLMALIRDKAASESEMEHAAHIVEKYRKELYENTMLVKIDKQIDRMEEQKRRLKVRELSFNSYYEFAVERIPQITSLEKITFDIHNFAAILKQFYRGGELEMTLNADLDVDLFNERFIVFEIDKIKDDPVLFPIVVLIIMDVFLQKMRIKKGRKALIIEEAWKAIASPTMAEYIKYLYKTVRKFHGIAGVVTQELNDVIDSPIVKEAIINNSDVKILLDQSKFKDRYEQIAAILGLPPRAAAADIHHQRARQPRGAQLLQGGVDMPGTAFRCVRRGGSPRMLLGLHHRTDGKGDIENIPAPLRHGAGGHHAHRGRPEEGGRPDILGVCQTSQPTSKSNVIMEKLKAILLGTFLFAASVPTFAGWRIVIDRNCIATVGANMASQKLIEGQHNRRLDSIASKKQKVELYTVSMATIKELYKLSMENISGFGTESLYYKEIGTCAFDILKDVPELVSTVGKAKFSNKLLCLNELGNLVAETQQLVGDFVNIVNNAKVQNPLKGEATAERKSDGYNLLDRYERLTLANRIYTDLTKIRYKVEGMMLMAQYATADDLFFAIDPEGWANVVTMKNRVGNLVRSWNGLVASNY